MVATSVCTGCSNTPPGCCTAIGSNPYPFFLPKQKHHPMGGVRVCWMRDSICIFAAGENQGCHQCLHWLLQHPTGVLHCYRFESLSFFCQNKNTTQMGGVFLLAEDEGFELLPNATHHTISCHFAWFFLVFGCFLPPSKHFQLMSKGKK